jgi:hypothetical protein
MSLNKSAAALLVLIFVPFSLAVILTWSAGANILNADAYMQALEGTDFFEVPYQLIRDGEIPTAGGLLLKQGPLSAVSGADMEAVARELAPPDWLRTQLEGSIRELLAVADANELDEMPDLVISLSEVKARAMGAPGDRALDIVVDALPECAAGQTPFDLSADTPICKPAVAGLKSFLKSLKQSLAPLVERLPDTYRVSWQPEQQDVLEDLQRAGQVLDQLKIFLPLSAALNLALLGLIWVLAVRSPAEWLRWTGLPLMLLGAAALPPALLAPRVVEWGLTRNDLWAEGNVPPSLGLALEQAIVDFSAILPRPALFVALALIVAGLALTLISPLFPGRRQRSTLTAR